jgi:hypothetical protein
LAVAVASFSAVFDVEEGVGAFADEPIVLESLDTVVTASEHVECFSDLSDLVVMAGVSKLLAELEEGKFE